MDGAKTAALFGHASAATPELANALNIQKSDLVVPEISLAVFAMNAQTGIDQETIELWHEFDELLMPRLLLITEIANGEQDFDDAVLIAKRVLDDVATPYLVLHDDAGKPAGLINLESQQVQNYQTNSIVEAEEEHKLLIADFRSEYLIQLEAAGPNGFEEGIFFPAIPIQLPNLGIDLARKYIERITKL